MNSAPKSVLAIIFTQFLKLSFLSIVMHQTLRLRINQISARTGLPYTGEFADHLKWYKFKSNCWLSERYAASIGVPIKARETKKGLKIGETLLYNAEQTKNVKKVEKLANLKAPRSAITRELLPLSVKSASSCGSGLWINAMELKYLGLHAKHNAKSVIIKKKLRNHCFVDTKAYELQSVKELKQLKKALSLKHMIASTGTPLSHLHTMLPVLRTTMKRGFKKGIWLSLAFIGKIGARLKANEEHTVVAFKHMRLGLYNVEQLMDQKPVLRYIRRFKSRQVRGLSGKVIENAASQKLAKYQAKRRWSKYWFTEKRLSKLRRALLPKQKPIAVSNAVAKTRYYNASQFRPYLLKKSIEMRHKYIAKHIKASCGYKCIRS